MSKLRLDPAQGSYSASIGAESVSVQLEGGKSRTRRTQLGAASIASVEWYLIDVEYQYLMSFYRAATEHGSESFTADLILDHSDIEEYECRFVPGTLELGGIRGTAYIVSASLEIIPLPEDREFDLAVISFYETYGTDFPLVLAGLSHLANVVMPETL